MNIGYWPNSLGVFAGLGGTLFLGLAVLHVVNGAAVPRPYETPPTAITQSTVTSASSSGIGSGWIGSWTPCG